MVAGRAEEARVSSRGSSTRTSVTMAPHRDDRKLLESLCSFELPELKVYRFASVLEHRRLELHVKVEHGLGLTRQSL